MTYKEFAVSLLLALICLTSIIGTWFLFNT